MLVNLSRIGKSGTGMWQYSLKLIEALHNLGILSGIICAKSHEPVLRQFGVKIISVPSWVSNTSKVSRIRPLLWFIYSFWLSVRLFFQKGEALIVSTTHHGLPLLNNQIITVHDLRPYHYPDSFLQKIYFNYLLPKALNRCQHVLTVSHNVKKQIVNCFGYPADKISVIYNAIDTSCFIPQVEKKPFLLAVGASWKHKNIDALLRVHDIWSHKYKLVIVCGQTDYVTQLKFYVMDNKLCDCVVFRHNVPFSELQLLYKEASALVYPSLDEGFGIPPIEAMACLTPVIVSNIAVFHEILGEAAIYVEHADKLSWESAMNKLPMNDEWRQQALICAKNYNIELMYKMISDWLEKMKV